MKRVLVISTSPRVKSNSDALAEEFNRGEGGKIYFRDIYMLSTAAEDEEFVPKRAESGLTGWVDCFEKASLKGTVFGGGVNDMGDIEGHPALQKAYEMGKSIK